MSWKFVCQDWNSTSISHYIQILLSPIVIISSANFKVWVFKACQIIFPVANLLSVTPNRFVNKAWWPQHSSSASCSDLQMRLMICWQSLPWGQLNANKKYSANNTPDGIICIIILLEQSNNAAFFESKSTSFIQNSSYGHNFQVVTILSDQHLQKDGCVFKQYPHGHHSHCL